MARCTEELNGTACFEPAAFVVSWIDPVSGESRQRELCAEDARDYLTWRRPEEIRVTCQALGQWRDGQQVEPMRYYLPDEEPEYRVV